MRADNPFFRIEVCVITLFVTIVKKLTCGSEDHDLLNDQEDLQFSFS